jgi:hypothetical protein
MSRMLRTKTILQRLSMSASWRLKVKLSHYGWKILEAHSEQQEPSGRNGTEDPVQRH